MNLKQINPSIKDLSIKTGFSVNHIRVLIALERVVARLEKHPILSEHLIFKGGFALLKESGVLRYTRDVDALARKIEKEEVGNYIREAISYDLQDGFWFGDTVTHDLMIDGNYGGLRFDCAFYIGGPLPSIIKINKLSRLHIDIGFGDAVPDLSKQQMPSWLLNTEPISWYVYPLENMLSEKLETLCRKGSANSRAKDLYDLVELFPCCKNKKKLFEAIKTTFKNRQTKIPTSFFDLINNLDPIILRSSWGSIFAPQKPSFGQAWESLLLYLQQLDADRKQK